MLTIIQDMIAREGGFINHPSDRGGPTKYGITIATLMDWRGRSVTIDDIQNLTVGEATEIYQAKYVKPFNWYKDRKWFELIVDSGVNHGVSKANKWLGELKAKYQTFDATNDQKIYVEICCKRLNLFANIVWSEPSQSAFIKGWINRVNEFLLQI